MNIFKQIGNFFLCLLRDDCQYSIKKILTWIFSGVAIYLIIFTDKNSYQLLMFILALLGIRAFEKWKAQRPNFTSGSSGSSGSNGSNGSSGKQLLND
jgi:hypothetical protein